MDIPALDLSHANLVYLLGSGIGLGGGFAMIGFFCGELEYLTLSDDWM